jgi:transcriptional regulator with XRE-family HTH domain
MIAGPCPWVCPSSLTAAVNVRRLRKQAGWSQSRLAREAGMSKCMVCALEAGHRNFTLAVLERMAGVLEATVHGLLTPPAGGGEGG